jgi:hypothetical protein
LKPNTAASRYSADGEGPVAKYDKLRMTATAEDKFVNAKMLKLSRRARIARIA